MWRWSIREYMNWRKPIIYLLLAVSGSKILKNLKEIEKINLLSVEDKQQYQKNKLIKILRHAYDKVPYYHRILEEVGVVVNNKIHLENFDKIPLLTKDIIRKEGKNLYSSDYKMRKSYENTSGGSTGEPVKFIQDKEYDGWNIASKIFFFKRFGKHEGEKEIKLWGSDRDIIKGNLTLKDRLVNFLYNRKFFNCYNFSEENMANLVKLHNTFKPSTYWAYVDGIFEFSKYILKNKIQLFTPKFIITTIGPLHEYNRQIIEEAFHCKVYSQYGSREMGVISVENECKEMDVFFWRHIVELSGKNSEKAMTVTSLDNYSMPLIRYSIGDVSGEGTQKYSFGETVSFLTTQPVVGRTLGFFKKKDGSLKHTHFLVQQLFFKDWIHKFQFIQKDYDLVEIKVVGKENKEEMKKIEDLIIGFLGNEFKIHWNFVDEIKPSSSGKYLYTVCEIK